MWYVACIGMCSCVCEGCGVGGELFVWTDGAERHGVCCACVEGGGVEDVCCVAQSVLGEEI